MHAEDLLVDNCGHREAIEAVRESFPKLDVISPLALVIETIDSIDRRALMIASQDEKVLWVFDLVGKQQADRFQ